MKLEETTKEEFIKTIESVLTVKSACSKHGLSRQTVYRWMRDDKKFAKEVKEAIKKFIRSEVEAARRNLIDQVSDCLSCLQKNKLGFVSVVPETLIALLKALAEEK